MMSTKRKRRAPGRPGELPAWTCSKKSGIGKALNAGSHISFSISEGSITESYYPREDTACLGMVYFIVTDGRQYFSDERKDCSHSTESIHPNVPGYRITNKSRDGRYSIIKEIIADPQRNSLLQQVRFIVHGSETLQLHSVSIPRFSKDAVKRKARLEKFYDLGMLLSDTDGMAMAVACSQPFIRMSVGYLGKSDGIRQLQDYKHIRHEYTMADNGNACLSATISEKGDQTFLLVTAFGHSAQEAAHNARASLYRGFSPANAEYQDAWITWHQSLWKPDSYMDRYPLLDHSANILRVSESKLFPGGILASLSIPWGEVRREDSLGAYHLVWPRDLVLSGGGFAALDDADSVHRVLNYLMTTQLSDGNWPQNMWLDGMANWSGIQLDQVAMPVILMQYCQQRGMLEPDTLQRYWPGLQLALDFIQKAGTLSEQDRWEEEPGVNTFTLSTIIGAFVCGAELAALLGDTQCQLRYLEQADELYGRIDDLTYVTGTELCSKYNVDGYYIRINPGFTAVEKVKNKKLEFNWPGSKTAIRVGECVCVDALALVRFGLRRADDPRILNTIRVIDATLKYELDGAHGWKRYTGDIFGETEQGDPYTDGSKSGIGRVWPLLTGERAHYEIAAGNFQYARELLDSMHRLSADGYLPEQSWDQEDIPSKGLVKGRPTGSAMPLTWAHAEYVKLCRSLEEKRVFDLPASVSRRYLGS